MAGPACDVLDCRERSPSGLLYFLYVEGHERTPRFGPAPAHRRAVDVASLHAVFGKKLL